MSKNDTKKAPETKAAMITIAGRPNVGKSTLTNTLVGEKIAIVSNKPQTTRNRICAILNRGDTQIVLMDTPGFHKARTRLGDYMVKVVRDSVAQVDAVVLMVEPIPSAGPQELQLIAQLVESHARAVLVINKIDTVAKEELLAVILAYSALYNFEAIIPLCAKSGEGTADLLDELEKFAIPGPKLFPEDMVTDQPEKQVCAEIVREKLLICLDKEIPHGTAVVVTKFSERDDEIIDLDVTIYCEKDSHKGMIIGKNGSMLKKVGEMARIDIERFMGTKVYLQTWVKVKENWRDSDALLRNFGYRE
ncbi:MAG: GTPase Era [Oscillospiraceae bacterium]